MIVHTKIIKPIILFLLVVSPLVSASHCYYGCSVIRNDDDGASKSKTWAYAERACYALGGSYGPATSNFSPSVRRVCYNVKQGSRITFEIANDARFEQRLDFKTCYRVLKALMDTCDHGGEQTVRGFTYVHEPNLGGCF